MILGNIPCDFCLATFEHASDVKKHYKTTHFGKKPNLCMICRIPLGTKQKLDFHMNAHKTGEMLPEKTLPTASNLLG